MCASAERPQRTAIAVLQPGWLEPLAIEPHEIVETPIVGIPGMLMNAAKRETS
jgi:hypothetical protein